MSGPDSRPVPDPEWLRRYEAKMADLIAAREERIREREERVQAWREVEERVDEAHAERAQRAAERGD